MAVASKTLYVRLAANVTGYQAAMGGAAASTEAFERRVVGSNARTGKSIGTLAQKARTGIALGVALAFAAAVKGAADFERNMRNVNSITGLSEQGLAKLGAQTLDLSKHLPQTANELSSGLYDIASSGFYGADGLTVLNSAATAASAGLSTTATSAQAITGVLNAYGRGAGDAADVSDVLFQTVNLGVVTFDELANTVGDFVGTAATAKVPIDDAAAALATMTLSGVSASEAGTSLNRVLQAFIKPSKAMQAELGRLGYESGTAALEQDGLRGVMEKLRHATGGQISQIAQLFPDIRMLRGATALMAAEGENYRRVTKAVADEEGRRGATARVLAEQSKSLSFQWAIFRNNLMAVAIAGGLHVTPILAEILKGLVALGHEGAPAIEHLRPLFESIISIIGDVVTVVQGAVTTFGPLGEAVIAIFGGAALTALTGFAQGLAAVTGFLADNKAIVFLLAAAYLATLAPAIVLNVQVLGRLIAIGFVDFVRRVVSGAGAMRAAFVSLASAESVATLGITAIIGALALGMNAINNAAAKGQEAADKIAGNLDVLHPHSAKTVAALAAVQTQLDKTNATAKHYSGLWGTMKAGFEAATPFTKNSAADAAYAGEKASQAYDDWAASVEQVKNHVSYLSNETGASRKTVIGLIDTLGIADKFTGAMFGPDSLDGMKQVRAALKDLGKTTGLSTRQMKQNVGDDIAAWQALGKAIEDSAKKTSEAFSSATDIITNFDASKDSISSYYEGVTKQANDFADNVQTAIGKGLDPSFVQHLLEAGPEQAGPLLDRIVAGHGDRMVELVNKSERALRRISARVVEFSRLTTLAVNSESDKMSTHLDDAMRIDSTVIEQGASATVDSVAKALGMKVGKVREIGRLFGITFAQGIKDGAGTVDIPVHGGGQTGTGKVYYKASGGLIEGPGTGTSDSIVARVSNGEYVVRASAVRRLGVKTLDKLNSFASGGLVAGSSMSTPPTPLFSGADFSSAWSPPVPTHSEIKSLRDREKSATDSLAVAEKRLAEARRDDSTSAATLASREATVARARRYAAKTTEEYNKAKRQADAPAFDLDDYAKSLDKMVHRQHRWEDDLSTITKRGGASVVETLRGMGQEGEKLVHKLATGSKHDFDEIVHDMEKLAPAAKASLATFGSSLHEQVSQSAATTRNLERLAERGYGALAKQIGAIGGEEGADLAKRAAGASSKRLRKISRDVRKAARQAQVGEHLDTILDLLGALSDSRGGLGVHALAEQLDVSEDEIIASAQLVPSRVKHLGRKSARLRADLANIRAGKPYATGGLVHGTGTGDSVHIRATPGEYVIGRRAVHAIGTEALDVLNSYGAGGMSSHLGARGGGQTVVVIHKYEGPAIGTLDVDVRGAHVNARDIVDEAVWAARTAGKSGLIGSGARRG